MKYYVPRRRNTLNIDFSDFNKNPNAVSPSRPMMDMFEEDRLSDVGPVSNNIFLIIM